MKKKRHLLFLYLMILIVMNVVAQPELKVLDVTKMVKAKKMINTTDIFELVEFIPLETNSKSIVAKDHLIVSDNEIFIYNRVDGKILKFNRKGKFIKAIGKKGGGPGEFAEVSWMQHSKDTIFIFDYVGGKQLIKYDTKDNAYEKITLEIESSFHICDIINDTCFLLSNQSPYRDKYNLHSDLSSYNSKGELIHQFSLSSKKMNYTMIPSIFYHFDNSLYYKSTYCDTVYQIISPYKRKAKYVLDFKNKKYVGDGSFSLDIPSGEIAIINFMETFNFILIDYIYNGSKRAIYDKNSNEFFQVEYGSHKDNINKCVFLWPKGPYPCIESTVSGEFVSIIEPYVLKKHDINELKIQSEYLKAQLTNLNKIAKLDDNPIIVIMKEKL